MPAAKPGRTVGALFQDERRRRVRCHQLKTRCCPPWRRRVHPSEARWSATTRQAPRRDPAGLAGRAQEVPVLVLSEWGAANGLRHSTLPFGPRPASPQPPKRLAAVDVLRDVQGAAAAWDAVPRRRRWGWTGQYPGRSGGVLPGRWLAGRRLALLPRGRLVRQVELDPHRRVVTQSVVEPVLPVAAPHSLRRPGTHTRGRSGAASGCALRGRSSLAVSRTR